MTDKPMQVAVDAGINTLAYTDAMRAKLNTGEMEVGLARIIQDATGLRELVEFVKGMPCTCVHTLHDDLEQCERCELLIKYGDTTDED